MTEDEARRILADYIKDDDSLDGGHSDRPMEWSPKVSNGSIELGHSDRYGIKEMYDVETLEAIVWWMRNKAGGEDE